MMSYFNQVLMRRLLDHSIASTERNATQEQANNPIYRMRGDIDPRKIPAGLLLVVDRKTYLMSNGRPALLDGPRGIRNLVAFAEYHERLEDDSPIPEQQTAEDAKASTCTFLSRAFCEALFAFSKNGLIEISDMQPDANANA